MGKNPWTFKLKEKTVPKIALNTQKEIYSDNHTEQYFTRGCAHKHTFLSVKLEGCMKM